MFDVTGAALGPHTTLRLGGAAKRLVTASDQDAIVRAVRAAGDPVLVLAGGSNVVVADEGFDGTVVLLRSAGVRLARTADGVALTVAAGHTWDDVVEETVAEGLAGVECLSGIPGSAGATPVQNVGAYGQEVAQTVTAVRVYDRAEKQERTLTPADCGFGYRDSRLKRDPGRLVVLEVTFALDQSELSRPIGYAELAGRLEIGVGERARLDDVRKAVIELRRGKGMVLDPADPDSRSAGSFFTNPIVPADRAVEGCPSWPADDGRLKLSAAWLVQHAGFGRGTRQGKVGTSSRHSLALTTEPGATATELLAFADRIVAAVQDQFGVTLIREPTAV